MLIQYSMVIILEKKTPKYIKLQKLIISLLKSLDNILLNPKKSLINLTVNIIVNHVLRY